MLFPIGDTPNPPRFTPWITWGLIVLNVLVFFGIGLPLSMAPADPASPLLAAYLRDLPAAAGQPLSAYDLFVYEHGYTPGRPEAADLFSALFLHAGLAHLLGNMLFLWIYGDNVEHRLGRLTFLAVYLLTGVIATLSFGALAGASMTPMVGASGAISGILGFYFVFFPRNHVKIFVFLFPFLVDVFLVPARLVLGLYVLLDNLLPILLSSGMDGGVAYGAHLGGFSAGLVLALGVERLAPLPARWREAPPAVAQRSMAELAALAEQLASRGEAAAGVRLARAALRDEPRNERLHAFLGLLYLTWGQHASAYPCLLRALELDPQGEAGAVARAALQHLALHKKLR